VAISADLVKQLRDETGAGVMDCKRALEDSGGNFESAKGLLREKGLAAVEKRSGREARQGVVETYVHGGGRIGVLVEVNCETDFVANTDEFRALAREIALQVAAMNPLGISEEDMPKDDSRGPEDLPLLAQPYVRDASRTIQELVRDTAAKTGENVVIRRFARFELGA
jgi:elongation factor Ts